MRIEKSTEETGEYKDFTNISRRGGVRGGVNESRKENRGKRRIKRFYQYK